MDRCCISPSSNKNRVLTRVGKLLNTTDQLDQVQKLSSVKCIDYLEQLERRSGNLVEWVTGSEFQCSLTPSIYETCLLLIADIPESDIQMLENIVGSNYVTKLIKQQLPDGSWSTDPRVDFPPDKVINTLSVLLVLNKYDLLSQQILYSALNYLSKSIPKILSINSDKKTIAMEGIVIELLMRCTRAQIPLPISLEELRHLKEEKDHKLSHKLAHARGGPSTVYSVLDAAATTNSIDWVRVASFQEIDGSMGVHPSSTIALMEHTSPDSEVYKRALIYLRNSIIPRQGVPAFSPANLFESWWALFYVTRSPLAPVIWQYANPEVFRAIPSEGIAVAESFSLPDVDTVAMNATALLTIGVEVDLAVLSPFYRDGIYECYPGENRLSVSANVHALMAIVAQATNSQSLHLPDYLRGQFISCLRRVLSEMSTLGYVTDKWYLSDIYTTAHTLELFIDILYLRDIPLDMLHLVREKIISIIRYLNEQYDPDGYWTIDAISSLEATGYALQALVKAEKAGFLKIDRHMLFAVKTFLLSRSAQTDLPLWVGKTLYRSEVITEAVQLSTLAIIETLITDD